MKNLRIFIVLIVMIITYASGFAEIIGDSVASIVNNWEKGEFAIYRNNSGRIHIEGRDTITERETPETISKLLLAEVLSNDDKVFIVTTEYADSTAMIKNLSDASMFTVTSDDETEKEDTLQTAKDKAELYAEFLKLMENPFTVITDFSGELKDIYNYDSLKADLDSCFDHIKAKITKKEIPDGTKLALMLTMQRFWDQAFSKESLMRRCELFRFYGYSYPFGTTIDHVKLPLLTGDVEIDGTMTFTCEPVETEEGTKLVEISTITSYDSDQVMDYVMSTFLSEEEKKESSLKDPERPYISMTVSENCLYEPKTGTLVEYIWEKRTTTPEKTILDYKVIEID